ncbi:MAG: hypothetical protein CVV64_19255 [Candidatus Wallbacteria bacterium HGW-Wallbacteria-1]|uniref:Uncharacterized protein n=1 Tax=Candidatus Wallbacteria bacterium HGW-Wallbacteria-1 TaxID=2013854 RepID=A0A2N1PJ46_9BACT|nr:MAG: hypothetical protein CVV64_19255 [Candidatus Wallbacteria bacterium HGW-Wallbacteria-1]
MKISNGHLTSSNTYYISVLNNIKNNFQKNNFIKFEQFFNEIVNEQDAQQVQKKYLSELKNLYEKGNLVLVIGAGLSVAQGIPDWATLLQTLYSKVLASEVDENLLDIISILLPKIADKSPIASARYINKDLLENKSSIEKEVRRIMYSNVSDTNSKLLDSIVNLCVAPGKAPQIDSVITYNFDDLLENAFDKLQPIKFRYKSIYATGHNPASNEFPVYHVHGYLPRNGHITDDNKITLSENIYHNQYSDIYSWNNLIQLNKFKDKNCLFIGISLSDPNLRRLLDISKIQSGNLTNHFIFRKKISVDDIKKHDIIKNLSDDIKDKKSKRSISLDKLAEVITHLLNKIEDEDAKSFNVTTIWVNDFSEYPKLISELNKSL